MLSSRHHISSAAAFLILAVLVALSGRVAAAADEIEARTIFTKFVTAQNAHDADAVKALLRYRLTSCRFWYPSYLLGVFQASRHKTTNF